ncbi:MAG: glycerol-3-phosphate acyltransferase [Clostridia bacterium]|nr:glycerol-3-phosphate acyltransferase [Clostridia bacterium]
MKLFYFSQDWWQLVLLALACYLVGSVNFARLISRSKNKDITTVGSGNPGTMNMSRTFGWKVGMLTFFCDAAKGGAPTLIGFFLYRNYMFAGTEMLMADFMRYFCGLFVIIGHIFPITMRFKGGKGIASTLGMFWFGLSCEWAWWSLIVLGLLLLVVLFIYCSEWGSMGSLLGVTGLSVIQMSIFFLRYVETPINAYLVCTYMFILAINLLTWIAHYQNLTRLFAGEEHHTSLKKMIKKKKA